MKEIFSMNIIKNSFGKTNCKIKMNYVNYSQIQSFKHQYQILDRFKVYDFILLVELHFTFLFVSVF